MCRWRIWVKRRTEALARANDEMQRFTHLVSHDIRAPLIGIVGFSAELSESTNDLVQFLERQGKAANDAELLHARRVAGEEMPEAIGFIQKSASKMETLLNAVLLVSRDGRREPQAGSGRYRAHGASRMRPQFSISFWKRKERSTRSWESAPSSPIGFRWSRSSAICSTMPSSTARRSGRFDSRSAA